ncbi:BMC domain-containing protein [Christensenella tenuis]|jgi:ethanolamine utilization protein EutM|uniref:BMC domain-containing protein n=1 Tax=Christensenella tenuis TaxID=2763033 RepID=A0ABR7EHL4_9FIRM|nr:BMC domain-containing protein [Christensenella tenuis]MBC5649252.1 BMC domain-containing protein [Christensenella tenuis]
MGKKKAGADIAKKNQAKERKTEAEGAGKEALGIVECRGITAAIEAADSMVKAAGVEVIGSQKIGNALIYIAVAGKVDAVREAVKTGSETVQRLGELYAAHTMARPDDAIFKIIKIISG